MGYKSLIGSGTRRWVAPFLITTLAGSLLAGSPARADISPPDLTAGWLDTMNWYRANSGLKPITSDPALTDAISSHLKYLINTDKVLRLGGFASPHTENPASPFYTKAGESAGKASNIITDGSSDENEAGAIDGWMSAPFHAIGILREGLKSSALDMKKSETGKTFWGLNVISGYSAGEKRTKNIFFPGDGAVTRISKFEGESPDPREGCDGDYKGFVGAPLFVSLISIPDKNPSVEINTPDGMVMAESDYCLQSRWSYKSTDAVMGPSGKSSFERENLIIIIPRSPLVRGLYQIKIRQDAKPEVAWKFTSVPAPTQDMVQGVADQKVAIRRVLSWDLTSAANDARLTGQRFRLWVCPANKCSTGTVIVDRSLDASTRSINLSELDDGFYFICIQPENKSGFAPCDYKIVHLRNSCDATTCFVGSLWKGPDSRCWQNYSSAVLEELRKKVWISVAVVKAVKGKCSTTKFPYSYEAKIKVGSVGEKTYRWRVLPNKGILGLALAPVSVNFLSLPSA